MAMLEFFYDVGSPWTYLAFHRIADVAAEAGAELVYKPILVGGVFNAVNPAVYESRANPVKPRAAYMGKDLSDWAAHYGLKIAWPPPVFPVNSVKAMRGALVALDEGCVESFSQAAFEAYWGEGRDISQEEEVLSLARAVGLDEVSFAERIASPEVKARLRANTDELVTRGGFGSPTMFVDRADLYFGNDRLVLVREALRR